MFNRQSCRATDPAEIAGLYMIINKSREMTAYKVSEKSDETRRQQGKNESNSSITKTS